MQQMVQRSVVFPRWEAATTPLVGGTLAGAASGALTPLLGTIAGEGAWSMLTALGATVLGSAALGGSGFDIIAVVSGALVLLAVASLIGALFGLVFGHILRLTTDFGLAIYSGLGYGMLLFMFLSFGPLAGTGIAAATLLMPLLLLTTVVGLFYTLLCPSPYAHPPLDA